MFSPSLLAPIDTGFVLVEQRVTWQASRQASKQASKQASMHACMHACKQAPSQAGNALVLADIRERSKTVARNKLIASSAHHDASLANSRVRAIKRVELFGLSGGAVRTLPQGRRDATGKRANGYRRRYSRRSGTSEQSMLLHSTWPRSSLRKWQCVLPAK